MRGPQRVAHRTDTLSVSMHKSRCLLRSLCCFAVVPAPTASAPTKGGGTAAALQSEVSKLHQQLAATIAAVGVSDDQRSAAVTALTTLLQQRQRELAEAQVAAAAAVAPTAVPAAASSKLAAALASLNATLLAPAAANAAIATIAGGATASAQPVARIYVGNVSYEVGEPELRALFGAFGRVTKVDTSFEATTGRTKGFAFVTFETVAAAESAIAGMNGQVIAGRTMKVAWPASAQGGGAAAGAAAAPSALAPDLLSAADAAAAAARAASGNAAPPAIRVFVGAVPYEMTDEHLRAIFGPFGTLRNVVLLPSTEGGGGHRGYGFIEFDEEEAGRAAIEAMNGFEIAGRRLKVSQATSSHAPGSGPQAVAGSGGGMAGGAYVGVAAPGGGMLGALGYGGPIVGGGGVDLAVAAAEAAAVTVIGAGAGGQPGAGAIDFAAIEASLGLRPAPASAVASSLSAYIAPLPQPSTAPPLPPAPSAIASSRVLALGNMATAAEAAEDPTIADEVREEAERVGGAVRSVEVYTHKRGGLATVFVEFVAAASASAAGAVLGRRSFGGRVISAKVVDEQRFTAGERESLTSA